MTDSQKFLIICGPTATGKTELGIKLAKKFHGEIISADSRQVYKGMDVGTGKDIVNSKLKTQNSKIKVKNKKFTIGYYLVNDIPVWGLDIVNPDYKFNVGEYKNIAQQIINNIWQRGKLPIVVGGTGLYIKSLISPMEYVEIPPNEILRKKLSNLEIEKLRNELEKLDRARLAKMNNSDRNNPRRLVRAIEIAKYFKSSPLSVIARSVATKQSKEIATATSWPRNDNLTDKDILLIGLTVDKEIIYKRIFQRIKKRLKQGIVNEIKNLLDMGYGWKLPSMSSLGYKEFKPYLEKKETLDEVIKKWQIAEQNYSQRQIVWFKKMPIIWFDISRVGFYTEVENIVCKFLLKP